MSGPYWSVQRVRSYGMAGMSGLGLGPDPVGSFFGAKGDEAKAKAAAEIVRIQQENRRLKEVALAKVSAGSASQWKRWTPIIAVGAVVVVGALALARSASKAKAAAR